VAGTEKKHNDQIVHCGRMGYSCLQMAVLVKLVSIQMWKGSKYRKLAMDRTGKNASPLHQERQSSYSDAWQFAGYFGF